MLLLVYVDDVLVDDSSTNMIARTKNELKTRFEMTDIGKSAFVLGIELVNNDDGSVTLCQRRYVDDVLKQFSMTDCKSVISPIDISSRLTPSNAAAKIDAPFREAVGSLMHLMTATRPDIAFAVGYVSRFMEKTQSSTGRRSSEFCDTCKEPSHMVSASSPVTTWTFAATRMQTGPVTTQIASRLRDMSSCSWVLR